MTTWQGIDDFIADNAEVIIFEPAAPKPGIAVGSLRVYDVTDALNQPIANDYLVKGLIAPRELSCWYGKPGSGKSFEMLYISYGIAQGKSVMGKRVHQGTVLYFALEATTGIAKRIKALHRDRGDCDHFHYVPQPVNFLDDVQVQDVIDAAKQTKAKLVVIDTLSRALAGGDENGADMGALVIAVDRVKFATGCHVAIVHHCGKNEAMGMRGHSSLLGATDVSVEISGQEGTRTATVEKNKEGVSGVTFGFNLRVVELGIDDDGDPITTCVVEESDAPVIQIGKRKLSETQAGWLQDIHNLFATPGTKIQKVAALPDMAPVNCVTRDQVREYLAQRGRFISTAGESLTPNDRQKLSRGLEALRDKGKLGISGDYIWVVQKPTAMS